MSAPTQGEGQVQPEVRVRSVRRRRSDPPPPPPPPVPNVRNWAIYAGLATVVTAMMLDGFLRHTAPPSALPHMAEATEVKSAVSQYGDSLQVVVSWDLTLSGPAGQPAAIRVRVATHSSRDSVVALQPPGQFADTAYLLAPAPGQTLTGVSCAAAEHPGQPFTESCTPWQYVRPTAAATTAAAMIPERIVIQPTGLQVDPDLLGRCAAWQLAHPSESVWTQVNQTAVPACTGPNGKPTVAQFCAFAVLPDGTKVKTANSAGNRYCDELFEVWIRERFS